MTAIARAVTRLRTTNNPPARKGASYVAPTARRGGHGLAVPLRPNETGLARLAFGAGARQYLAVYFVSITRLRLRHWRFLPTFAWYALFSTLQARCAAGHRFSLVAKDAGLVF